MEEFDQRTKAEGNGGLIGGLGGLVGSIMIFSGPFDKASNIDSQVSNLHNQIQGINSQLPDLSRQSPTIKYVAGEFIHEEIHTKQQKIGMLTHERPGTPSVPLFSLEMAGGLAVGAVLGIAVVNGVRYGLWRHRRGQSTESTPSRTA